jgi:glycerol-3-phosphate dehydrogenase
VNREDSLARLQDASTTWDVLVIGGGATGLACAVDAAARGYRTGLLEQSDFAKATSSRSTKLIHGGFRYLKQGNLALVRHSLRERGLLLQNAPHLVRRLAFVVPHYAWWERPYYGLGLKLYDRLAGGLGLGASRHLSRGQALDLLPTLHPDGLRGGIRYYDGQFDDARLAICLAQTAHDQGGCAANYVRVLNLTKASGRLQGARAVDLESGREWDIRARTIINATGIFTDSIRRLDERDVRPMIQVSQGSHLVVDQSFLPGGNALMIPRTRDGRVLFVIPWHDRVLIGTTDTAIPEPVLEPRALEEEIAFLLDHAGHYLSKAPGRADVRSVFAGLRPLVSSGKGSVTSRLSRDHTIQISKSGLVTVTGGKWTTCRQMAAETIDQALRVAGLDFRPCRTQDLKLHGWVSGTNPDDPLRLYGSDSDLIRNETREKPAGNDAVHPARPCARSEVLWFIRQEMARTVEDILARRTRLLLLDARAAIESAPSVAGMLATELGRDGNWEQDQVQAFERVARGYILGNQ